MRENNLDVPFPTAGLDESGPFSRQRPGTTPDCLNVRGFDPRTGRARGSQRPGLVKHCETAINGTASIQEITHCTSTQAVPYGAGLVYGFKSGTGWDIIGVDGVTLYSIAALENTLCLFDERGDYYVAFGEQTGGSTLPLVIRKYVGETGTLLWELTLDSGDATTYSPLGMEISDGILYVWAATGTGASNTQMYRVDPHAGLTIGTAPWLTTTLLSWDRIGLVINGVNTQMAIGKSKIFIIAYNSDDDALKFQIITKSSGAVDTTVTVKSSGAYEATDCCGDDSDNFYFCFADNTVGAGNTDTLRKVDSTGSTAWSYTGSTDMNSVCFDRLASRLLACGSALGGGANNVGIFDASAGTLTTGASINAGSEVRGIRPDNRERYRFAGLINQIGSIDASLTEIWRNTYTSVSGYFMACGGGQSLTSGTAASPRTTRGLAVAGGKVVGFDRTGIISVTSGTGALSVSRPTIHSEQFGDYVYFADGENYKRYQISTNTVGTWSASAGSLPSSGTDKPRLLCVHDGALWLSGIKSDPANWFKSRTGDPTDFDYGPATVDELQAIAGNDPRVGKPGDLITCLASLSERKLFMGCDHSIYLLDGNPMSDGVLRILSNQIGCAWGRPYTFSPDGTFYFYGSRGGVFRIQPGGVPVPVSQAIAKRLEDVDLGRVIVRLAWDERQQGLHLYLTPLDPTEDTYHYWMDGKTGGWWPDQFGDLDHNPKCVWVIDGDLPDDRFELIGSWDGYIRRFDDDEDDDDGTAIESHVVVGPILAKQGGSFMLKDLQATLEADSGDLDWSVQVGESAQAALAAESFTDGTFEAGRNRSTLVRAAGHAAYVRLSNETLNSSWSLESLLAVIMPLPGRTRQRVF